MAGEKSEGLLSGIIIGAAVGAIAGMLAAPRTGKDTRRILKKSADALPELAEDLATSIQFQADRLSDHSLSNWEQTLDRLREAIVAGRAAGRQEWERQCDPFTDSPTKHANHESSIETNSQSTGEPTGQPNPYEQVSNWSAVQPTILEE
ncbi:YtxH domain-containing protein [Synechococcus sp. PCC 7335]|uniref:YtxH domain-containing protein n=1 Tax=Synechococcus sp. (strain ATCC 29403 / PCC 7335) TaxID=91464 RepID=UPI000303378E|nr:YtxH domain-containing protein [Synechococcus sp. PCC 7335]